MLKILSEQQVDTYRQNGFVSPIRAMSAADALAYRRRFEEYERVNGGWYELSKGQKLYLLQTWVAELASHPKVLDAVEDALGPDILVWGSSLFVKDAHNPSYVSWHQDATYWGLSKPEQLLHHDTLAKDNLLTRGQEIAVEVDEAEAVFLELQPGEISLHNIKTAHASEPNRSNDRRIGVAIRYIAPHVQQIAAEKDSAWLVRGEDRHGHFIHETPPKTDMDAAALAEHKRIMALRQGVLYRGVQGKPAHTEL